MNISSIVFQSVIFQLLFYLVVSVYPGSFYSILLRYNRPKTRKNPRFAPIPSRLWAFLDPPASLGSLGNEPRHTNRVARSFRHLGHRDPHPTNVNHPQGDLRFVPVITPLPGVEPDVIFESEVTERPLEGRETTPAEIVENTTDGQTESIGGIETTTNFMGTEGSVDLGHINQDKLITILPVPVSGATTTTSSTTAATPTTSTTAPPFVCGAEYEITANVETYDPSYTNPASNMTIESPNFKNGGIPDGTTCTWTFTAGNKCLLGTMLLRVNDGYVKETKLCSDGHFQLKVGSSVRKSYCGKFNKVSDSFGWSSVLTYVVELKVGSSEYNSVDNGFKLNLLSYCYTYSDSFMDEMKALSSSSTTSSSSPTTQAPLVASVAPAAAQLPDIVDATTIIPDESTPVEAMTSAETELPSVVSTSQLPDIDDSTTIIPDETSIASESDVTANIVRSGETTAFVPFQETLRSDLSTLPILKADIETTTIRPVINKQPGKMPISSFIPIRPLRHNFDKLSYTNMQHFQNAKLSPQALIPQLLLRQR